LLVLQIGPNFTRDLLLHNPASVRSSLAVATPTPPGSILALGMALFLFAAIGIGWMISSLATYITIPCATF
jgi:hypothetical protein